MKKIYSGLILLNILLLITIFVLFKSTENHINYSFDKIDNGINQIQTSIYNDNDEIANQKEDINELAIENEQLLDTIEQMKKNIDYLEDRNTFLNDIYTMTLREINTNNKDTDISKITLNGVNVADILQLKELTDGMSIIKEEGGYKHIIIDNVNIIIDSKTGKMCKMYCENIGQLNIDGLTINIGDDYQDVVSKTSSYIDSFLADYPYKFTGQFNINKEYLLIYYTIENKSDLSRPLLTNIEIRSRDCDW